MLILSQEPKDPLENLCIILEKLSRLSDENKRLRERVDFLERQDALQQIIINSTLNTKYDKQKEACITREESWESKDKRRE